MTDFTPGPWSCDGAVSEYEGARFGEVAYVLSKGREQFPATAANARLIAAAPDLYAALEAYNDYEKLPTDRGGKSGAKSKAFQNFIQMKSTSLAKARGENA